MRSILFGGDAARATTFARLLETEGYAPEVRIVDDPATANISFDEHPIAFIDAELGAVRVCALVRRIRGTTTSAAVLPLLGLIGEPPADDMDVLVAAGINMFFPAEPKIVHRVRFLRSAIENRIAFARLLRERTDFETELRKGLETARDPMLVHRHGKTLWFNRKWTEHYGWELADCLGKPIAEYASAANRALVAQRVADREAGKPDLPPLRAPVLHKDGHEIEALMLGLPTIHDGEPALLTVLHDLTEQRKLETQLMATDRLASLGRLAASVGHEITNPLTYVMANIELTLARLRRGHADPAELTKMLGEALEGADRVRRIVQDLRVFSPRQPEELGNVDVRRVIESCLRMTAGEVQARGTLIQHVEALPPVRANEARLAQVITNLLLNAAQALPSGSAQGRITIDARRAGDHVEIRVEDNGEGIPPEHLPHVFEPFFTTKIDRGGTGLGLSICHLLVVSQGGQIALTSEPGQGTAVTVRLPVAAPAQPAAPAEPRAVTRRRVLLVDDEIKIAQLVQSMLDEHEVTIAGGGADALTLITSADRFDVIVCDLMMPGLGGIDVYAEIARRYPGLERRIVFITGGAFTSGTERFLADVPNTCLAKPFTTQSLVDAIEAAAAR